MLPRLRAAVALLSLSAASGAAGQQQQAPGYRCSVMQNAPGVFYTFTGWYAGPRLHPTGEEAWLLLTAAGRAGEQALSVKLHTVNGPTLRAWAGPFSGKAGAPVSALVQQGKKRTNLTGTLNADGKIDVQGKGSVDVTKPVTVVFSIDGRQVDRASFAGASYSLDDYLARNSAQFVGRDENRLPAGCTSPGGSMPCFLTTATVECIGLADDCWELRTLRRFRDRVLQESEEGRALIDDYYAVAPRIVAAVSARADARMIWLRTYWSGVLPSVVAARLGCRGVALKLYSRMVRSLEATALS